MSLYSNLLTVLTPYANKIKQNEIDIRTAMSLSGGAPIVVGSTSAMTDTDQIYVLSTDGQWYYHNGTTWVSGGTYGAVATDTTLTQSGIPADAKAVGDELSDLKSAIDNVSVYAKTTDYAWREGYRIATSASPVDINAIYASPAYSCQILEVKKGEKYTLTAKQGNNIYNAYCFTDTNLNKIETSRIGTYEDAEITVPANGYLIVCTEDRNYQRLIRYEVLSSLIADNQQAKEDIARIDISCKNIETITFPESFYERGQFGSSGSEADSDYRIRTKEKIKTTRDVTIVPQSGYLVQIVIYNEDGVYEDQTSFSSTPYVINANKQFRVAISNAVVTTVVSLEEKDKVLFINASYDEYLIHKNISDLNEYDLSVKKGLLSYHAEIFGTESNDNGQVYKVGTGQLYPTISDAISQWENDNYPNATIFIGNGIYKESITVEGKTIRFIGESRDGTIVHTTSGNYTDPPFNIRHGNVTLKNMTIIADHTENPDFDYETGQGLKAYGVHIDGGSVGGVVTVENCTVMSFQAPALGTGTIPNSKIRVIDCDCYCFTDYTADSSSHQAYQLGLGCILWHSSNSGVYPDRGDESFELVNVKAYMKNNYAVFKVNRSNQTDSMDTLAINTLLLSGRNPYNQNPVSGYVHPIEGSIGNSENVLNYSQT